MTDVLDPASSAETTTREKKPRRWLVPVLAALLVVSLATTATFVALWLRTQEVTSDDVGSYITEQKPEVEDVSKEVIGLLINYDSTNIDQVSERMLELATGNFRKDYEDTFAQGLGQAIQNVSASTRGEIVLGPDVSFRGPSEAVAIARVTQTTQNESLPEGRTFVYVMAITLIDTVDEGWKADRVEILAGQQS